MQRETRWTNLRQKNVHFQSGHFFIPSYTTTVYPSLYEYPEADTHPMFMQVLRSLEMAPDTVSGHEFVRNPITSIVILIATLKSTMLHCKL